MKNCLTQGDKVTIICSGETTELTLLPLTFMKFIDVNSALGDKDLGKVLEKPTPYDLATVLYCLLDDASKEKIAGMVLKIGTEEEQTNEIHKLFYLMCDNNVVDGLTNYTGVLQTVVKVITDSMGESSDKKKLLQILRWTWKKFTTR